jgi:hypothetical protein
MRIEVLSRAVLMCAAVAAGVAAPVRFSATELTAPATAACTTCCAQAGALCVVCAETCVAVESAYDNGGGRCTHEH